GRGRGCACLQRGGRDAARGREGPRGGRDRAGLTGVARREGGPAMTPEQAVERLNVVFAHAWMVRTFLKHAEEIQDDEELLEVPRTIFDYVRATEPAHLRGDVQEYLRRARGKLPKLRRAAGVFARGDRRGSDPTHFQMGAASARRRVRPDGE